MKKHTYRTLIIYGLLVISLIYIYPTIGWMMLSDEQRDARIARWQEEDSTYKERNFWRENWQAIKRWTEFDRNEVINLGLDLQGGVHMILGLDMDKVDPALIKEREANGWKYDDIVKQYQEAALQRIRRRIDQFEAKEPVVQSMGNSQIQVALPGEKDITRARKLITQTAYLTFHMDMGKDETEGVFKKIEEKFPRQFVPFLVKPERLGTYTPYEIPIENMDAVRRTVEKAREAGGLIPEGKEIYFSRPPRLGDKQIYEIYLLDKAPGMTGEGLKLAVARQDSQRGPNQWQILFQFDAASGQKFGELTEKNIGQAMAIVVDDVVESAPVIQGRITVDGEITGDFSREQAHDLAIALTSGSMPVPIREDFTGVVGASLGADSIRKGVWSSAAGMLAVLIFMIVYYRFAGLVANIALVVNAIMMLAAFAYFKATLTLPGIAGLILSIGMAVDANVLIYERIREEIRNGKSLLGAIEAGFNRATVTILDSNLTTLIAAVVLLQFGSGPILSFAISLCIGMLTSLFTGIVVTHAVFDFATSHKLISRLPMMTLLRDDLRVRFMDKRVYAFGASGLVILVGIVALVWRGSDNFGVEFTTGTTMIVNLETDTQLSVGNVRSVLANSGIEDAEVTTYEQGSVAAKNRFFIRLGEELAPGALQGPEAPPADPSATEASSAAEMTVSGKIEQALASLCASPDQVKFEQVDTVGPAVGDQLKWDAIKALIWSHIFLILYMWFRFEFKYGAGAVIAVMHDVLISMAFVALTGRQFSLSVIAAILTIIGYSVNDTIVIFDRVRENLRLYRGRGMNLPEVLDISVNQTLARTIITNLTVFFVVLAILFFGGPVINDFAFVMTIGMISGTYSTIFIASPVALYWQKWFGKQPVGTGGGDKGERGGRRRRAPEKTRSEEATA